VTLLSASKALDTRLCDRGSDLTMKRSVHLVIAVLLAVATTPAANAQANPPAVTEQNATVTAGRQYDAGLLTRKLFGNGWRAVWTAPVTVPVFDMSSYAGGVKPTEKGSGNQTISLRFKEETGWREYHFRSVNKNPVALAMPSAIRGTTFGNIVQDLTSSLYPAAGLMVPPLLDAIDVLQVTPALYVMPDDPRLGEYRAEFAGMLGAVELSPQEAPGHEPGFGNSRRIESGENFLNDVVQSSRENRLDEREFFAARLVDFLINDNDRTAANIRFARYGEKGAYQWRPIPRDRDRAFSDARGWLIRLVGRPVYPKLIAFNSHYSLAGLTFESSTLDRRLLQRLTRDDAEQIAQRVQIAMDDATIESAIAQLPREWRERSGDRLRTVLKARRHGLPAFARDFYAWLATEVDVHGTDETDRAVITRHDDGRVTVTVTGSEDSSSAEPFSRRTFLPGETNEVRLYLHGGNDSAVVNGASNGAITVRIIGGDGNDVLADSAGGDATRFYDAKGDDKFITRRGTRVSVDDWAEPRHGSGVRFDAPWRPDWGSSFGWGPALDYQHGAGVIVGFGPHYTSQGFRRLPHKMSVSTHLLLSLWNRRPGVRVDADYRAENSPLAVTLAARATKFEEFSFHGFGNDVPKVNRALSEVEQDLISIKPSIVWQIGWRTRENLGSGFSDKDRALPGLRPLVGRIEAGPVVLWNKPHASLGSPLSDKDILGSKSLGCAGVRLGLSLDRTSPGPVSDRGWRASVELAGYPPVWDVERSFSTAAAAVATYLPLPGNGTHLALRAGGEMASGSVPVQYAPAIGGRRTLRGYGHQRFRGDTSTSGSAELRIPTGTVPLFIRWNTGVFGLADAGRVWFDGRSEGAWHTSVGGGIWLSSLGQTFSLAYAHGDGHHFYLQNGLSF
jgi:hypothetical protein